MVTAVSTTSPRLRKSCRIEAGDAVQPAGSSRLASAVTSGRFASTRRTTSTCRAAATTRTPGETDTDSAGSTSTRRLMEPYGNRDTDPVTATLLDTTTPSTCKSTTARSAGLRHGR